MIAAGAKARERDPPSYGTRHRLEGVVRVPPPELAAIVGPPAVGSMTGRQPADMSEPGSERDETHDRERVADRAEQTLARCRQGVGRSVPVNRQVCKARDTIDRDSGRVSRQPAACRVGTDGERDVAWHVGD